MSKAKKKVVDSDKMVFLVGRPKCDHSRDKSHPVFSGCSQETATLGGDEAPGSEASPPGTTPKVLVLFFLGNTAFSHSSVASNVFYSKNISRS
jgi:hypothetical protein